MLEDENYTPEITHAAFDDANHGSQYWDFLYEMIGDLPLLNLWDASQLPTADFGGPTTIFR